MSMNPKLRSAMIAALSECSSARLAELIVDHLETAVPSISAAEPRILELERQLDAALVEINELKDESRELANTLDTYQQTIETHIVTINNYRAQSITKSVEIERLVQEKQKLQADVEFYKSLAYEGYFTAPTTAQAGAQLSTQSVADQLGARNIHPCSDTER